MHPPGSDSKAQTILCETIVEAFDSDPGQVEQSIFHFIVRPGENSGSTELLVQYPLIKRMGCIKKEFEPRLVILKCIYTGHVPDLVRIRRGTDRTFEMVNNFKPHPR